MNFSAFWDQATRVWTHGLFGQNIGSLLVALGIFTFFLIARGILAKYVLARLSAWVQRTPNKIDDGILPCLMGPLKFIPVILGVFFAGHYLDLSGNAAEFIDRLTRTLISYTIFWAIFRICDPLSKSFKTLERLLTPIMVQWIFKVLKVLVVFIGGAVILEVWGIAVGPLLAGLGLFGAAVALGAQDLFKNLIAGMTVIAEKRFYPGEWVLVEGMVEGTVEEIGFRSTRIRRFDKAPMYVPNAKLSDAIVTNFSRMTYRRIRWLIGLSHDTDMNTVRNIRDKMMEYFETHKALFAPQEEAPYVVRIENISPSSVDLLIQCYTRSIDYAEWMEIKEDLAMKIKQTVEEDSKASFAAPSQSLVLKSVPSELPEIFVPPQNAARRAL